MREPIATMRSVRFRAAPDMTMIRVACTDDAGILAALSGELGYPATPDRIVARLATIEASGAACVFVAEDAQRRVIGWLHVAQAAHLTGDADAEILGLVVADSMRGAGIGADLLRVAEDWAHAQGATQLQVRSRTEREGAHRFYERAGYARIKTQAVFRKILV